MALPDTSIIAEILGSHGSIGISPYRCSYLHQHDCMPFFSQHSLIPTIYPEERLWCPGDPDHFQRAAAPLNNTLAVQNGLYENSTTTFPLEQPSRQGLPMRVASTPAPSSRGLLASDSHSRGPQNSLRSWNRRYIVSCFPSARSSDKWHLGFIWRPCLYPLVV